MYNSPHKPLQAPQFVGQPEKKLEKICHFPPSMKIPLEHFQFKPVEFAAGISDPAYRAL